MKKTLRAAAQEIRNYLHECDYASESIDSIESNLRELHFYGKPPTICDYMQFYFEHFIEDDTRSNYLDENNFESEKDISVSWEKSYRGTLFANKFYCETTQSTPSTPANDAFYLKAMP